MPTHLCGAGLGFLGFSTSLIIGLYVNNNFVDIITRALVVLVLFYLLGYVLALLGQKTIQENFENTIKADQKNFDTKPTETAQTVENPKNSDQPLTT